MITIYILMGFTIGFGVGLSFGIHQALKVVTINEK